MKNEEIKIVIDNITVMGEILNQSTRDLDVMITKPYNGLVEGTTIPIVASQFKKFEGEYRYQRAKEILEEIYYICKDLDNNKEKLKSELPAYDKEKARLEQSQEDLREQKKELKKQLKSGNINHKDYQKAITSLNKKIENLSDEINELFDTYFNKHLSREAPDIDTVINSIRNGNFHDFKNTSK